MKHWLRRKFNRHWYSMCSMHRDYEKTCELCHSGRWMNGYLVEHQAREFRRTHEVVNGQWKKKECSS